MSNLTGSISNVQTLSGALNSGGGAAVATDYNVLVNKPSINNIELNGNKTLNDLGIQPKGDYASKNDIPDTSSFITKEVSNLSNYYNKTSIDEMIGDIETLLGGI